MATKSHSQQSKQFFNLISKLGTEVLTPQDMDKLCNVLDMTEKFSSPIQFFYHLQNAGIFAEDNVDEFLEALIKSNLMMAAHEVKNYVEAIDLKSGVDFDRIELSDDASTGCMEHRQPLELFCNPCNKQICFECAFFHHRGEPHEVLNENEIEKEVEKCKDDVKAKLHILEQKVTDTRNAMSNSGHLPDPKLDRFISEQFDHWLSLTELHKTFIDNVLRLHAEKQNMKMQLFRDKVNTLNSRLKDIKNNFQHKQSHERHKPSQIRQLKQWREEIIKMRKEIEAEMEEFEEHNHIKTSVLPLSPQGKIIEFHRGSVVSAISVSKQGAVIVRDERRHGKGVTLSCVSSTDQGLFWVHEKHEFDENDEYPVVTAGSLFVKGDSHSKILLASGSLLMIISVSREDFICSIVDTKMTSLNFDKGCYATAMTTITRNDRDTGVLISCNLSTVVTRLNRELEYFDSLDCSAYVHSISSMACVDNEIVIIDSSRNEAVVLAECGRIILSGKLHVPTSSSCDMKPKLVQWDGSFWGVIWEGVSNGSLEEPQWQHAIYLRNGDEYASNVKGQCKPSTEVVSMSFLQDQSMICFTDGKVQTFATNTNL